MDINEYSRLYRRKLNLVSDGSPTVRLALRPVAPKTVRVLTHVTVENKTSAYTKCRLGISNGRIDYYLDELTTIAAEELAVSRSDVVLGEGDIFFAELTGTGSGEALVMICVGWESEL